MSESGHSQPGMYGQGRRRRRRRDRDGPPGQNLSGPSRDREYIPRERRDGSEEAPGPHLQKTPIILAKPPGERSKPTQSVPISGVPAMEKPIVLFKARDDGAKPGTSPEGTPLASSSGPSKLEREGQRPTQPVYQIQNRGMAAAAAASSSTVDPVIGQTKLLPPEKMKHSIKLVDDQMNWCDSAMEYLRDQTDMLVVGVIGLQGTGKSTIMSLLSANTPEEDQRGYVFRAQSQEIKERGGNQSTGIDFFITQERVIFLDTQPILSPSILDHLINNDRKLPPEYNLPHTYVEMQSLQITAFLFTICHVVVVVQDWFTDINLYRYLSTGDSYRSIAFSYRVGFCTVARIVKSVCEAIWQCMVSTYMPVPGAEDWRKIAGDFEKLADFPNCLGAIDGKHVVIQAPPSTGSQYFNYKGAFSIVLLAVVDARYRFRVIDVGAYGRSSDGGTLASSAFGTALQLGNLDLPADRPLPGADHLGPQPHVFIGDEAFPLRRNLLRPYPGQNLGGERRIYNFRLSHARRIVECAFGILANQWRLYRRVLGVSPEVAESAVKATCILHNYMRWDGEEEDGPRSPIVPSQGAVQSIPRVGSNNASREAVAVRKTFSSYFSSLPGRVTWQDGI